MEKELSKEEVQELGSTLDPKPSVVKSTDDWEKVDTTPQ